MMKLEKGKVMAFEATENRCARRGDEAGQEKPWTILSNEVNIKVLWYMHDHIWHGRRLTPVAPGKVYGMESKVGNASRSSSNGGHSRVSKIA